MGTLTLHTLYMNIKRNLTGTLQETCRNFAASPHEPYRGLTGILLEPFRASTGTLHEHSGDLTDTSQKPHRNPA